MCIHIFGKLEEYRQRIIAPHQEDLILRTKIRCNKVVQLYENDGEGRHFELIFFLLLEGGGENLQLSAIGRQYHLFAK